MGKPADPYEVLGLRKCDRPASDVVRKAYHRLARIHHPDKARTPEDRDAAEARFKEIGSAYDILSDPVKREKYDARGFEDEWMDPREAEVRRGGGRGRGGSDIHRLVCVLPRGATSPSLFFPLLLFSSSAARLTVILFRLHPQNA